MFYLYSILNSSTLDQTRIVIEADNVNIAKECLLKLYPNSIFTMEPAKIDKVIMKNV